MVLSLLAVAALWEILGRFVITSRLFFAPLSAVLGALADLVMSGELVRHLQVSGVEFIVGLGLAVAVGIPTGVLIAAREAVGDYLDPIIAVLYSTPLVATAPLFILWLGIDVTSKVAVVFLVAVFPVVMNTADGIRSTDQGYIDVARAFGATNLQITTRVLLRWALPFVLTGFRLAVGRALVGVVVAEMFGARAGLGFLILISGETFNAPRLFASILVLTFSGVLLLGGGQFLEQRLLPWRKMSIQGD